jgi:thioredoxin-like negative regulator of GroEL
VSHALVARVIGSKPRLFFFTSGTSGRCRLVEGHLASVLQAGRNHQAFDVTRIDIDQRPDVADRFRIGAVPTFLVVQTVESVAALTMSATSCSCGRSSNTGSTRRCRTQRAGDYRGQGS